MKQTRLKDFARLGLMPALLALLTACGGGSGEEEPCGGTLIAVATGGLSCIGQVSSSSPPPPSPPPAAAPPADDPPPPTRTVVMNSIDEYEPNSTPDNANPVNFLDAAPEQSIGIEAFGNVGRGDDAADFFIITPTRTDHFLVYLCGPSCTEQPITDEVYIAVYDQSQTTIAATPIGVEAEQFIRVELTAGLAYYVEINGYNTGSDGLDYQLVVID